MNKELDAKLCSKYPKLYAQRNLSPQETAMCWGFPGDGWYDIIDNLSAKLEPLGVEAVQAKEKFGTLRFYIGACSEESWDEVYGAINEAEELSGKTCEYCGEPGTQTEGDWTKTLCEKCDTKSSVEKWEKG